MKGASKRPATSAGRLIWGLFLVVLYPLNHEIGQNGPLQYERWS